MSQDHDDSPNLFASPNESEQAQPSPDDLKFLLPETVDSKAGPLTIGMTLRGLVCVFIDEELCYAHRIPKMTLNETHEMSIKGHHYTIDIHAGLKVSMSICEDGTEIWSGKATSKVDWKLNLKQIVIIFIVTFIITLAIRTIF